MSMINAFIPLQHLDKPPSLAVDADGLCYFYFTPVENVLRWPSFNPKAGSFTEEIILKENTTWYRCQVIENNRVYTEEQINDNPAGPYLRMTLTGFLPGDTSANGYTTNSMKYRQFALVIKERNGIMRLVGDQYTGADFSQSYSSEDTEGTRGRSIVFTWEAEDIAPFYLTTVTEDISIIIPPWHEPEAGVDYVTDFVDGTAVAGQNDYTFPALVGNNILLVAVPPVVMYESPLQDQYIYNKDTGTVHFNYPLKSGQDFTILYNRQL